MGRIAECFEALGGAGEGGGKALIPFVTTGDPDLEFTKDLIFRLEETGADLVELGVPFSDPMADGPTIQRSSFRSLKNGTSLRAILGMVGEIRKDVRLPLVLMTYYNPIFAMGEGGFVEAAVRAGVAGPPLRRIGPPDGLDGRDAVGHHCDARPDQHAQAADDDLRESPGFHLLRRPTRRHGRAGRAGRGSEGQSRERQGPDRPSGGRRVRD